ncbi:hypothetical protein ES703_103927 [subsurface metagenome]
MLGELDSFREKVEQEIKTILGTLTPPLFELDVMNSYHMGFSDREGNPTEDSKGKYLRPLFCIAMCAGLGGDPEQAVPAAAALELAHRTSLIFDDIQDRGKERNNQPTVWAIWGADQAINAGLVLSCYGRMALHRLTLRNVLVEKVLEIQSVLENAVIDLCRGQYMDISFVDSFTVGVEDYLWMVRGKTGALFGAACAVGAMLASPEQDAMPVPHEISEGKKFRYIRADPTISSAWEFGLNMGIAFQIHDDYLGVWGNEAMVGKTANDILERKRTLPLILGMKKDPDYIRRLFGLEYIGKRRVKGLTAWMEKVGIKEQVEKIEARYIGIARANLKALSLRLEWQNQFEEVLSFLSERKI